MSYCMVRLESKLQTNVLNRNSDTSVLNNEIYDTELEYVVYDYETNMNNVQID
jgi:hypothetical protein